MACANILGFEDRSSSGGISGDCSEPTPGAAVNATIGGTPQAAVAAQAAADFAGVASTTVHELTTACRGLATDLDVPATDATRAGAIADKTARMTAWCELATAQLSSAKAQAGGSMTITATVVACTLSTSAKADCQTRCNGGVTCDLVRSPPQCAGGSLNISCSGACTAEPGVTLTCEGTCDGACNGIFKRRHRPLRVACVGTCDGTCEPTGGVGFGIQADGTCHGNCKGTCAVTPPGTVCTGSCNGGCSGTCRAQAGPCCMQWAL